jgi:hypothetical protein
MLAACWSAAELTVERRSQTGADGKSIIDETWQAKADDGSMLEVQLQFVRGVPTRGKGEPKLHSDRQPEFYRHYKVELVANMARSAVTGIDGVNKFSIKATGPRFEPLFNGAEQLISITSAPSYSLAVYVPVDAVAKRRRSIRKSAMTLPSNQRIRIPTEHVKCEFESRRPIQFVAT